jgi:membrane dipeptidase
VGIGTDWPLQMPKSILKETMAKVAAEWFKEGQLVKPEVNLEGFDDYRDFPNITRGLVRRGYSDKETKGILGENFLRVFETVCG